MSLLAVSINVKTYHAEQTNVNYFGDQFIFCYIKIFTSAVYEPVSNKRYKLACTPTEDAIGGSRGGSGLRGSGGRSNPLPTPDFNYFIFIKSAKRTPHTFIYMNPFSKNPGSTPGRRTASTYTGSSASPLWKAKGQKYLQVDVR